MRVYIYIYMYIYLYMCVYIYIYIYIHTCSSCGESPWLTLLPDCCKIAVCNAVCRESAQLAEGLGVPPIVALRDLRGHGELPLPSMKLQNAYAIGVSTLFVTTASAESLNGTILGVFCSSPPCPKSYTPKQYCLANTIHYIISPHKQNRNPHMPIDSWIPQGASDSVARRRRKAESRSTTDAGRIHSQKQFTLLDLCMSSLHRGHANLLCIVPILTDA